MSAFGCKATVTDGVKFECYLNLVPGALFWFSPLRAIAREALAERLGLLRLRCLLLGVKRTRISALHRSAFDPKRTSLRISIAFLAMGLS